MVHSLMYYYISPKIAIRVKTNNVYTSDSSVGPRCFSSAKVAEWDSHSRDMRPAKPKIFIIWPLKGKKLVDPNLNQ